MVQKVKDKKSFGKKLLEIIEEANRVVKEFQLKMFAKKVDKMLKREKKAFK